MSDGNKLIIRGSPEARRPARCSLGTDWPEKDGRREEEERERGCRGRACSRLREVIGGSVMEFHGGKQLK